LPLFPVWLMGSSPCCRCHMASMAGCSSTWCGSRRVRCSSICRSTSGERCEDSIAFERPAVPEVKMITVGALLPAVQCTAAAAIFNPQFS